MRDKVSDFLLSSRYDPLFIETGEADMECSDDQSVVSNSGSLMMTQSKPPSVSRSPQRVNSSTKKRSVECEFKLEDTMKSVIDMYSQAAKGVTVAEKTAAKAIDYFVENLSNDDLFKIIDQHKLRLEFLNANKMCTEVKRDDILEKIEGMFEIISQRTSKDGGTGDGLNRSVSK